MFKKFMFVELIKFVKLLGLICTNKSMVVLSILLRHLGFMGILDRLIMLLLNWHSLDLPELLHAKDKRIISSLMSLHRPLEQTMTRTIMPEEVVVSEYNSSD